MTIPTMLKVLFSWLADRLEGGDRLQPPPGDLGLSFFTDAKAEGGVPGDRPRLPGAVVLPAGR